MTDITRMTAREAMRLDPKPRIVSLCGVWLAESSDGANCWASNDGSLVVAAMPMPYATGHHWVIRAHEICSAAEIAEDALWKLRNGIIAACDAVNTLLNHDDFAWKRVERPT